jgi:phosphatidylglycerophosphate synthase
MWLSKVWLNKLPADLRQAIFDLGLEASKFGLQASIEITRTWEKKWEEEGGTVHRLSAKERREFMRRARPLGEKSLGGNPKTREMWQVIKAAAEATREGRAGAERRSAASIGRRRGARRKVVASEPVLWDQKIGRWLARPLAGTSVRPNHVTVVDLVIGVASGVAIAFDHPSLGGVLFLIARLVDCVDGELARLQGTSSKFGEYFDLVAGSATYLAFFAGLAAWSYAHVRSDHVTILLVVILAAVLVNTVLLMVRQRLLRDHGEEFPTFGRINLEDGAYLIPVGLWLGYPF